MNPLDPKSPEFDEFWQWWNLALNRLKDRPGFEHLSWDRLACYLLWMNIRGEPPP